MAIKIPSKNIYEINNPKIIKNVIDKVTFNGKEVLPQIKNNSNILIFRKTKNLNIPFDAIEENGYENQSIDNYGAYIGFFPYYTKDISIQIPKTFENKKINKINTGTYQDENGTQVDLMPISINAIKIKGTAKGTYDISSKTVTNIQKTYDSTEEKITYSKEPIGALEYNYENNMIELDIKETWNRYYGSLVHYTSPSIQDKGNHYELAFQVVTGYESVTMGGWETGDISSFDIGYGTSYGSGYGYCEKVIPQSLEVTINGETIEAELSDYKITLGDGNNPFSINGSELTQPSNYILHKPSSGAIYAYVTEVDESPYNVYLSQRVSYDGTTHYLKEGDFVLLALDNTYYEIKKNEKGYYFNSNVKFEKETTIAFFEIRANPNSELCFNILNQYAKGKETATLLCDINEYYEYNTSKPNNKGELAISTKDITKKMTFEIGDVVVPMVMGSNGKDKPMSLKQDGTPKVFVVVGTNKIYDGAVWQELYLQEK